MQRDGLIERFGTWPWMLVGLAFAAFLSRGLPAQEAREVPERIMSAVRADPRVKDILADFHEVRLEPEYAPDFGVWIVHFIHADQGPKGLISVDAESGEILEFSFEPDRRPPEHERAEERESDLLRSLWPRFGGMNVAWLSFVLVAVVVGRFRCILSRRNLDILLLYALAPLLHVTWTHTKLAYTGIFVVTVLLFARCLWAGTGSGAPLIEPNLRHSRALWMLLAFALLLHVVTLYERGIGDVGIWSAVGGEYLLRTGRLPYGTEFGPNCVYGPLMYVLFAPAGWAASFIREIAPDGSIVLTSFGNWQAMRGVQTTELVLDLLAWLALYRLARRRADRDMALTVVFAYAISPYLIGMTGELGLERASHIAAAPFILAALLLLGRPALGGVLLGIAAGMLYYPLFLVPLWFGYLRRQESLRHGLMFLAGFVAVGIVCVVMLLVMVKPVDDSESPLGAFLDDTIAQQQFKPGYGNSPLSFWGQYPELARWGKPTASVLYGLFCVALALFPRRIDFARLIALTAALLVGTQFVLSHAGGKYIGFYLAPLILTLFGLRPARETTVT
ncbi:MAG: hypothetical protein JSW27_10715 [Phycisphaerales bacterium]|nr:MAG: hypothetical protein JSW27_10715 [Phycisphaerales bacterium]